MAENGRVCISVWSDYVCPFCYLEEPVLQRLKQEYGDRIEIEWRAFELRPEPVPTLDPSGEYLRTTWAQAVYPMAAQRGMTLRLPPVQPRSRKALEAAEFAREQGRFEELHNALFRAFFEDGRDLADLSVLAEVAAAAGLDPKELRGALEAGRYTDRVLQDLELAHELGVSGVPAMLVRQCGAPLYDGTMISGAQPYEIVRSVVNYVLAGSSRINLVG